MEHILDYEKEMWCIDKLIELHHIETAYRRCDYVLAHIQQSDPSSSWEQAFRQKLDEINCLPYGTDHYLIGDWRMEYDARKRASSMISEIRSDIKEGDHAKLVSDCLRLYRSFVISGDGVEFYEEIMDIINNVLEEYERIFVLSNVPDMSR